MMHLSMIFDPNACIYDAANLSPTDGQADSRSWMIHVCVIHVCMMHVWPLILMHVCMMHMSLILDPDVCWYVACVYDAYIYDP